MSSSSLKNRNNLSRETRPPLQMSQGTVKRQVVVEGNQVAFEAEEGYLEKGEVR